MKKIVEFFSNRNRSEIVNLCGFLAVIILSLIDVILYVIIGAAASIIVIFLLCIFYVSFSFLIWKNNIPCLWLFEGVGCVILSFCSNLAGFLFNFCFIIQSVVSFICFFSGIICKVKEKTRVAKYSVTSLISFIMIAVLCAGSWVSPIITVKAKKSSAQNELWAVPDKYDSFECVQQGKIEEFVYSTKAYATDKREVTKRALVYLPYGYDENLKYNILYLLHGTGDDENYWLDKFSYNKTMVDNMIYYGDIQPLIIVTPTWYVEDDCLIGDEIEKLTYSFKDELRNDLIPQVEKKYSTFACGNVEENNLIATRDYRAMAGLSRGSATTFRSGISKNLDYISWFGAFSGCLTDWEYFEKYMNGDGMSEYSINYLYNTAGTFDFLTREHVKNFKLLLQNDDRLILNRNCSMDVFPMRYHSMASWHIALYNFLQKIF